MELKPGYKQTKAGIIPEDWEVAELGDLIDYTKGYAFKSSEYTSDGIRIVRVSDTTYDSIREEDPVFVSKNKASKYSKWRLREDDLVISTVGSKPPMYDSMVGRVILIQPRHEGALLNQNAVLIRDKKRRAHFQRILLNHLRTKRYLTRIESIFRGNANQASITLKELFQFAIPLPDADTEQRAIARALSDADALISALDQLIAKKRDFKQAVMQQLLTGQKRLPGFTAKWEVKKIGELLKYERPEKYLVRSADYQDSAKIPVLTANKSFVLGHTNENFGIYDDLPVIIFDDFTTDSKYVDFPFKVKSSAIKILKVRSANTSLKFVHERMRLIQFPLGEHKRYYISEYQHVEIPTPEPDEQTVISKVLSDMDAEIAALEQRRDKTRALKQGMMQELLTGRTRLV